MSDDGRDKREQARLAIAGLLQTLTELPHFDAIERGAFAALSHRLEVEEHEAGRDAALVLHVAQLVFLDEATLESVDPRAELLLYAGARAVAGRPPVREVLEPALAFAHEQLLRAVPSVVAVAEPCPRRRREEEMH